MTRAFESDGTIPGEDPFALLVRLAVDAEAQGEMHGQDCPYHRPDKELVLGRLRDPPYIGKDEE